MAGYGIHYLRKRDSAVMDLSLFRLKPVWVGFLIGVLTRLCIAGVVFLLTILYQVVFGMSPLHSGFMLLPVGLGGILVRPFYKPLLKQFDHRGIHLLSSILMVLSILSMATINGHGSVAGLVLRAFCFGFGYSLNIMNSNIFFFYDVPEDRASQANSILMTFRQFFWSLGIVLCVILLTYSQHFYALGVSSFLDMNHPSAKFQVSFCLLTIISLLYVVPSFLLWRFIPESERPSQDVVEEAR